MAVRLTAWLEEICATQLLLGNHWLNDKNRTRDDYRQTGVRVDPEREWEGLYHDNGSCLDITNDIPQGRDCYLTIIKARATIASPLSPLQFTDGHSYLPAQIAPTCAAKLRLRPRLWDTILVRKYTIRYTSYGPPHLKLRFILEAASWVGNQCTVNQPDTTKLSRLRSEELVAAFCRLDETRAAQDYRCLGSTSRIGAETRSIHSTMDQAGESSQSVSQAHTQYAFGTQIPHQSRPLSLEDELRLLSVKRLEPVLAGNTQREEIAPRAASSRAQPADVLRLLGINNSPAASKANPMAVIQEAEVNHLQTLISECAWMQDMEFTRDSFKVPYDQMSLLRSDSSWHKPLPGYRFPDGNVPIAVLTTLHRMADEAAALEAAPDSDEEMDEDPSPEFPIDTVDPSPEDTPQHGHNAGIATSQVSWSPSPSPVPPKLLTRPSHQLPPDSSFEAAHMHDDGGMKEKMPQPILVESSSDTSDADEPHASPSSPSIAFDDDIEMEEYVPQGLGEDSVGGPYELQPSCASSVSPPPHSVVQVHETPYAKGKSGQHRAKVTSPSSFKLTSGNTIKNTSSLGVTVHGHAVGDGLVAPLEQVPRLSPLQPTRLQVIQDQNFRILPETEAQSAQELPGSPSVLATQVPSMPEQQPQTIQSSKEATVSASPVSGRMKRRHNDSPTKRNGRHSKRREIKIVGFGDGLPGPRHPITALQSYREDSLRKPQEARISNTILETRSRSSDGAEGLDGVDAMHIYSFSGADDDTPAPGMSPRHESLYEDSSGTNIKVSRVSQPISTALPAVRSRETPVAEASVPQARSLIADSSVKAATDEKSIGVFLSFKTAYPEYTGDAKHFTGQCRQMVQLDGEDKMVPKWQWDDYIIRNRTDFREYALQCVDQGDHPEPYYRFYKDSIRDTLYQKGVVASRATLLRALDELNGDAPHRDSRFQPELITRKPKRSRASLPNAFHQSKTTLEDRVSSTSHERSRHSLPAKTQRNRPTYVENVAPSKAIYSTPTALGEALPDGQSTSKAETYSRLSLAGAASSRASKNKEAIPRTGDQFRDFCFAFKRTSSITGSTNVSLEKGKGIGRKS
ncbi:hypothetical protein DE146DRAFT_609392 [Phaeosphaeria sp. MPI-PUGE-AT-0046c]|nr:hypothetical protein DE146DRAFT_609392 [Phaeosphaeria sp. MPI-PUGE-AT-0046c]